MAGAVSLLSVLPFLLAILGQSGLGLQHAVTDVVTLHSCEELTTSLAVNQLAILQMMRDASHASSGIAEREERQEEAADARDASLQEVVKVVQALQAGQQDLRAMVENATQETLTGMAALRQELTSEVTSLRQELTSLRQEMQQQQDSLHEEMIRPTTCPDGWLRHESSCYLVDGMGRTWEESLAYCRGRGGDLAKITSAEEQEFIKGKLQDWTWIGLNDRAREGHFVWTDGSTPTYTAWEEGQPNDYLGQDCGIMESTYNYKWSDVSCSSTYRVVCERPVGA